MELIDDHLPALQRPWAVALQDKPHLLNQIHEAVNGPFHVIHPPTFSANLRSFVEVLNDEGVAGQIFFGKKANKAGSWLREVAQVGGGVDVASVPELAHTLANGVRGEDIEVTGAAKSDELLWLAGRHGSLVAIDSLDELTRALQVRDTVGPLRILLRILPKESPQSRFGLNPTDLNEALRWCECNPTDLSLCGFSFHLDGYEVAPRAALASHLIDRCLTVRERIPSCNAISIGGGFACQYVEREDWERFLRNSGPTSFHAERRFAKFYPYYQAPTGSEMLRAILRTPSGDSVLAQRLKRHEIKLYAEPGRALLDGAGFSVFPVQGFKRNADHGIVTVAGLSMSLSEQWKNSEFLPDPCLVQRDPRASSHPVRVAIGGSSCMEYDMLTWRKVRLPSQPQYGDYIIYPNTAGYQMDKNESEFHQLPLPPKVAIKQLSDTILWRIDDAH